MLQTSLMNFMTRRQLLTKAPAVAALGMTAAACAQEPAANAPAPAAPEEAPDEVSLETAEENLKAFIRMTASLDPSVETTGWFGGTIFAVQGTEALKPLVDVEGYGIMRVAPQDDGTYRIFNRELAFYKDPRTGEFIDTWVNPLNGETCEVSPIHNAVVNAEIAPIIKQDFDGTIVEIPFRPPWIFMGDKVFSTFEVHTAFPNPMDPAKWPKESSGPVSRISEMFQRITPRAELLDPLRDSADFQGSWTRVGPWLPWMLMGQTPGHVLYRTYMDKTVSVDDLPPKLLARARERYPDFQQAPGDETWGQPNDSSFTVYMEEREPVT